MKSLQLGFVLVMLNNFHLADVRFQFTNFECQQFDKTYTTISTCKLKLVQRGVVALDLYVKIHKIPNYNVSVACQVLKKANGYRPFLFNLSHDFCQVMKNRKKFPFASIIINLLEPYSNINHTCPYNHDIIVKRLILKDEMFRLLPAPNGDYMVFLKVFAYNDLKAAFKFYVKVTESIF